MIEFLQDYSTESLPPESFKTGQQVKRSEQSERYFVGRGLAAYVVDGKLVDADQRPIATQLAVVEVVQPGDHRSGLGFRAGEVMTGQPPRASSGPGLPLLDAALAPEGSPPVVLEAEVERLTAELADANAEGDKLAQAIAQANGDLHAERQAHAATRDELVRHQTDLGAADQGRKEAEQRVADLQAQVATLEGKLAEATKAAVEGQQSGDTGAKKAK